MSLINDPVLWNDGSSALWNDNEPIQWNTQSFVEEAGASGGRVRKSVGQQLVNDDLGSRPSMKMQGLSQAKLVISTKGLSRGKLVIRNVSESFAKIVQLFEHGISVSKIVHAHLAESTSKIKIFTKGQSKAKLDMEFRFKRFEDYTRTKLGKLKRLFELQSLLYQVDYMDTIYENVKPVIYSFEFDEKTNNEQLIAFTHSSSFVGNVAWNSETLEMTIILSGKQYNFCNVPGRVFEGFRGASSKGAFFAREIKEQFNC